MWQKLRARTLNLEARSVARAPPYVALNVCCVDVQTLPVVSGSMFAGIGSIVAGRGSMVAVRGSRFVGGSSRVAVRVPGAQTPHYRRVERLLRRRSGGVVRLPCRCLSGSRFAIPLLRCHTISARNVRCGDVRAVWHVSRVVGDTQKADLVSDIQPMSIDVGTHSCSTHGALPARIKAIHWSVCGADARVSPFTWGIPVS